MLIITRYCVIAAVLAACVLTAPAASFDPAADFSLASNPNGPWSYGYALAQDGSLILYTNKGIIERMDVWNKPIQLVTPWIARNSTASAVEWNGTARYEPGALSLHPGPQNQRAILRFTPPSAGQYSVAGFFYGQDFWGPTTTDVHLLLNGASIFDGTITFFGGSVPFNKALTLDNADRLDFVVGFGGNSFYYDSTGLSALIENEPGPRLFYRRLEGAGLELSWTTNTTGFRLETTSALGLEPWVEVESPVNVQGAVFAVSVDMAPTRRFFRLTKP